jgi:hypothetical protein
LNDADVLSMEKLYPLWDVMLATGTKNFTYFIAVAWLIQMRDSIIGAGMNHMMMFFSELRDANLMLVVDIAEVSTYPHIHISTGRGLTCLL